jgi:hypothetical protein
MQSQTNQSPSDIVTGFGELPPVGGLQDALEARFGTDTPRYYLEYGPRADDAAMVLHFYGSKDHYLRTQKGGLMPDEWAHLGGMQVMCDALNAAMPQCFKTDEVYGEWSPELQSFFVKIEGIGNSLDPSYFVKKFTASVDAELPASA